MGMTVLMVESSERRKAFGEALASALAARGLTQRELGDLLGGTAQSAISSWKSGEYEPSAETVFELERVLKLSPGHLSRHLGYFPPEAMSGKVPATFENVVLDDPLLDDTMKNGLIAQYKAWTEIRRRRRRPS